jgi:hypothetical protein
MPPNKIEKGPAGQRIELRLNDRELGAFAGLGDRALHVGLVQVFGPTQILSTNSDSMLSEDDVFSRVVGTAAVQSDFTMRRPARVALLA